jgi:hypothetical protein
MGLCTNRILMGQLLIALFISAMRHLSSPAPSRSASNDSRKMNGSSFDHCWHKPAVEGQAEHVCSAPGISDIILLRNSRTLPQRRRTLKCDEHGVRLLLLHEMRRLACAPTKSESQDRETVRSTVLQAVRSPGGTVPLIGSIQQSRLSSNLTRRTLSYRTARVQDRSS